MARQSKQTHWFVELKGQNQDTAKNAITDYINNLGPTCFSTEPQEFLDVSGKKHVGFELPEKCVSYLHSCRSNMGIDFAPFFLNPGSDRVMQDHHLYAGGKKKPTGDVLVAKKAADDILKKKKKGRKDE